MPHFIGNQIQHCHGQPLQIRKKHGKINISQVIQNDLFYPLVGGHLTFGRVTFHHPKKITKNCQVRRLNTWLWPLYTFQPAVGSNKLLGGSSDWNGPQKPQANVLENQIRPTNPNASQQKFVWTLFRMTLLLFKTPLETRLLQPFPRLLFASPTLFRNTLPQDIVNTLYNTSPQLTLHSCSLQYFSSTLQRSSLAILYNSFQHCSTTPFSKACYNTLLILYNTLR